MVLRAEHAAVSEAARLAVLDGYDIVNSAAEPGFDRLTRIAAELLDAPIALVTLLDGSRQWFKSAVGLDLRSTARADAFCDHTIRQQGVMTVLDARNDPRFADSPLVTGPPYIRFYAGAPLITPEGAALGGMCIIDRVPRPALSPRDRQLLEDLAAMVVDQMELRRLYRTALEAQRQADDANASKTAFVASISHEIRNSVNAMSANVRLLSQHQLEPQPAGYVAALGASVETLDELLGHSLDLARIEAGKLDLAAVPFELRSLCETAIGQIRTKVAMRGLAFAIELPEPPLWLIGDPLRLRQILLNLFSNAVKFTESGQIAFAAKLVDSAAGEAAIAFSVSDTGIGMGQAIVDRLFVAFDQGGREITQRFGGSGLGLAISHRLVEALGGRLEVVSAVGKGSRFSFTLRLPITVQPAGYSQKSIVGPSPAPRIPVTPMRLLLAEDCPINQRVIREILQRDGHTVDVADNGGQTLRMAVETRYDAVLLDTNLGDLDGTEVIDLLRTGAGLSRDVPVIAVTGDVTPEDRERCLAAGMDAFVPKPIDFTLLARVLTSVASSRAPDGGVLVAGSAGFDPTPLHDLLACGDADRIAQTYAQLADRCRDLRPLLAKIAADPGPVPADPGLAATLQELEAEAGVLGFPVLWRTVEGLAAIIATDTPPRDAAERTLRALDDAMATIAGTVAAIIAEATKAA